MVSKESKYRLSVKAFIMNENSEILIIKRSEKLKNTPNVWELPGGKIIPGNDPFQALIDETKKETSIEINILHPLSVRHFKRDNGEIITMIVFFCNPISSKVKLGERHSDHKWANIDQASKLLSPFFKYEIAMYKNLKNGHYHHI